MPLDLSLELTLILLMLVAGVMVLAGYLGARPPNLLKVRMIEWRLVMVMAAAVLIILLVHLLTVLGLKQNTTGF